MTITHVGLVTSAVVAICITGQIAFLFLYRVPVLGRVGNHDYPESERQLEGGDRMRLSGYHFPPEDFPVRNVCARVSYSYGGVDYRNDVIITVDKGSAPDKLVQLWIDPHDPNNVTVRGPGFWFYCLFLTALLAIGCAIGGSHVPF